MAGYFDDDAEIERVALGFIARTLPKVEWTHAAHFSTTLWLLRHRPELELEAALPPLIRAYNESVGGVNSDIAGYHETITQASLAQARLFMAKIPAATPLHEAVDELMSGMLGEADPVLAAGATRLGRPGYPPAAGLT
jgi:hypothetical protein